MKAPKIKRVGEDCWSVRWGVTIVEFSFDLYGNRMVQVYPDGDECGFNYKSADGMDVSGPLMEGKANASFFHAQRRKKIIREKEVNPMEMKPAEELPTKKKMTKKEGKEAKKKDYYAGKEVKAR